jgi:hypothetical protein
MKYHRITFLFVAFILITLSTKNIYAQDRFQWMWSTDKVGYFFDTETIKFGNKLDEKLSESVATYGTSANLKEETSPVIIDVWIKTAYSPVAVKEMLRDITSNELLVKYEKFSYVLNHMQINIHAKKFRTLESYMYSSDGTMLYKSTADSHSWENIIPDSNCEGWTNYIIEYISANFGEVLARSNYKSKLP